MTRVARAKGSKASNERVPESATSWEVMKQDLKKTKDAVLNKTEVENINAMRQKSYDNFIDEEEKKVGKTWTKFPLKKIPMKAKHKITKKKIIVNKKSITEADITDEMIDSFVNSDEETDSKIEGFKKEIESVLRKVKNKKSPKKNLETDNESPEEQSTKVPSKEIIIKKKKAKKQNTLNIKSPNSLKQNVTNQTSVEKNVKKQKNKSDKHKNIKTPVKNLPQNQQKLKVAKTRDDKDHKRRKPDLEDQMSVTVNGNKMQIARYEGFPVLKNDVERLQELRKTLMKKGVPQSEVKRTIQTERRKAEKHLSRLKKYVCFNCRKSGHVLSECPELNNKSSSLVDTVGIGICFKCGSTEHKLSECNSKDGNGLKYAHCFICREQGHLARECPDNPRGLYPQGGSCRLCGDVTHLKKDCPQLLETQSKSTISVGIISEGNIDSLDCDIETVQQSAAKKKTSAKKVTKF